MRIKMEQPQEFEGFYITPITNNTSFPDFFPLLPKEIEYSDIGSFVDRLLEYAHLEIPYKASDIKNLAEITVKGHQILAHAILHYLINTTDLTLIKKIELLF